MFGAVAEGRGGVGRWGLWLLLAWAVAWWSGGWPCQPAVAQDQAPPRVAGDEVTPETVKDLIDSIQAAKDIDDASKQKVLAVYRQALQDLGMAAAWAARVSEYEELSRTASDELSRTKALLAAPETAPQSKLSEAAPLRQLEEGLAAAERSLASATDALTKAEAEPRRRTIRRLEIRRLLKAAQERLAGLGRQPALPLSEEGVEPAELARRVRLRTSRVAVGEEILAYEKELAAYEATAPLLPLRQDLAARTASQARTEVANLKKWVSAARRREAEDQLSAARLEAALALPAVRDLADANEVLAKKRSELLERAERAEDTLAQVRQAAAGLTKDINRVKDKVKSVGQTNAIGQLLRTQRASLPDPYGYLQAIAQGQDEIPSVQMELFSLEERRSALTDLDAQVAAVLERLDHAVSKTQQEDLEFAVRELLDTQKRYVDLLLEEYGRYFNVLVELDTAQQELVAEIEDYRAYIDQQVLWIRSAPPLWSGANWHLDTVLRWFPTTSSWQAAAKALAVDVRRYPLVWLAGCCAIVLLFCVQRRTRNTVNRLGERASASGMQYFLPTARVVLLTALLAVPLFAVLAFLSWRIAASMEVSELARAVAAGFWVSVAVYFPVEFFRQTCRVGGLAEKHFGWPVPAVRWVHRYLTRLILFTLPLVFIAATSNARVDTRWQESLGRICCVAALCFAACGMHRLLRRRGDVFRAVLAEHPQGWLNRMFYVWYLFGVVVPLLLAAVATLGYYYTAWQLASRWLQTLLLLMSLLIVGALLFRWILIVRRRLAMHQAREQRQQAQAEASLPADAAAPAEPQPTLAYGNEADLATINAQARRLVYTFLAVGTVLGLWMIWVDVLPALGVLRQVPLWDSAVEVTQIESTVEGVPTVSTIPQYRKVTLAELAWAALVALVTFVAARNIPGMLEISLLQHLPLDKGLRYAITAVCRYLLFGLGIVWVCGFLGLTWSKVQWILAAMSVGLGFGLQEIFANFVSGLVILFERPIRVGDIITIGDATGKVTRIQMRATTIQDWDRKELVVPNKEFTIGRLLNWTLTDSINRLVIEVGVAYDSDPEQVREVLLRVAKEHPRVLADPKPIAIFREFGNSALIFSLRIYLAKMKGRLEVMHQMHAAIHKAFAEAGIEIAYPQLDLHLKPRKREAAEGPSQIDALAGPAGGAADA